MSALLGYGYGSKFNHQGAAGFSQFLVLVPFTRIQIGAPIFDPHPYEEASNDPQGNQVTVGRSVLQSEFNGGLRRQTSGKDQHKVHLAATSFARAICLRGILFVLVCIISNHSMLDLF